LPWRPTRKNPNTSHLREQGGRANPATTERIFSRYRIVVGSELTIDPDYRPSLLSESEVYIRRATAQSIRFARAKSRVPHAAETPARRRESPTSDRFSLPGQTCFHTLSLRDFGFDALGDSVRIHRKMDTLSQLKHDLPEMCERYGIAYVDAFGSFAREDQDPKSDIDLIIEFKEPRRASISDRFFGFLHAVEDRYNRNVDLLTERSLRNPYLIREVNEDRRRIYG